MGSLYRRRQKSVWLIKNCWLCTFLIVALVAVGYPFFALRVGKEAWMNCFLEACPFLFPALGLAACIRQIMPSVEINSILVEISYYAIWGITLLVVLLASQGVKFGKPITYSLFVLDVIFNLISQHFFAVVVDITLIVIISLLLRSRK